MTTVDLRLTIHDIENKLDAQTEELAKLNESLKQIIDIMQHKEDKKEDIK